MASVRVKPPFARQRSGSLGLSPSERADQALETIRALVDGESEAASEVDDGRLNKLVLAVYKKHDNAFVAESALGSLQFLCHKVAPFPLESVKMLLLIAASEEASEVARLLCVKLLTRKCPAEEAEKYMDELTRLVQQVYSNSALRLLKKSCLVLLEGLPLSALKLAVSEEMTRETFLIPALVEEDDSEGLDPRMEQIRFSYLSLLVASIGKDSEKLASYLTSERIANYVTRLCALCEKAPVMCSILIRLCQSDLVKDRLTKDIQLKKNLTDWASQSDLGLVTLATAIGLESFGFSDAESLDKLVKNLRSVLQVASSSLAPSPLLSLALQAITSAYQVIQSKPETTDDLELNCLISLTENGIFELLLRQAIANTKAVLPNLLSLVQVIAKHKYGKGAVVLAIRDSGLQGDVWALTSSASLSSAQIETVKEIQSWSASLPQEIANRLSDIRAFVIVTEEKADLCERVLEKFGFQLAQSITRFYIMKGTMGANATNADILLQLVSEETEEHRKRQKLE